MTTQHTNELINLPLFEAKTTPADQPDRRALLFAQLLSALTVPGCQCAVCVDRRSSAQFWAGAH